MNRIFAMLVLPALLPLGAWAQLEFTGDEPPVSVFAGSAQEVRVAIRNASDKLIETEATMRLYQVTSGSVVPVGDAQAWKKLRVLPKQTVLERIPVTLPAVRAATVFRLECPGIGRVTMTGYPADLLKGLNALRGENPVAVFDPDNKLKPVLKQAGVEFADYEVDVQDARLALVWSAAKTLPEPVVTRVRKGMAVVWIRPQKAPVYVLRPIVLMPASDLTGLAESAQSQVNLLHFAELALKPEPWQLPQEQN